MKNILFSRYFVTLGILSVLIFSQCKDEEYTDYGTLNATAPTVAVTWDAPASMVEYDTTFNFTITLSEVQIADVIFNISAASSTATEGEDFDLTTHSIRIPAYSLSASGSLIVYSDALPEDVETIAVQIGDISLGNVNYTPETYNVELANLVSDDILLAFDWGNIVDVTIGGTLYEDVSLCDNVDIDFLIAQDTPGGDIGDYTTATGACPESYLLNSSTWTNGDGTFYFGVNLYANGGVTPDSGPMPFPVAINVAQTGVVNISVSQDASTVVMSDNDGTTLDPIVKLVVSNNATNFAIYDAVTDVLIYSN